MSEPTTQPKYYHALNASQSRKKNGLKIFFDPYQHLSGTWWGIFKTSVPAEQAALDELVKDPKSAVTAITPEEYALCYKKKYSLSQSSGVLIAPPIPADQSPMMPPPASVVGEPSTSELPTPAPAVKPLKTASEALDLGPVNQIAPAPAEAATDGCDLS